MTLFLFNYAQSLEIVNYYIMLTAIRHTTHSGLNLAFSDLC